MAGNKDSKRQQLANSNWQRPGKRTNPKSKTKTHKTSKTQKKSRRRAWRDAYMGRVTTFPEAKGKVVREVRFTHDDPNNTLAIAFKDRTVLVFQVDPEPLVLPLDIHAHYIGEGPGAVKSWERLALDDKG